MDPWLIWLITAPVLAVAEIFTLTAALGLLGGAALVTAGFAALGPPLPLQFLVFTVVAVGSVLFVRPVVLRRVSRPQAERFGVDALVGGSADVVSEVTGAGGRAAASARSLAAVGERVTLPQFRLPGRRSRRSPVWLRLSFCAR